MKPPDKRVIITYRLERANESLQAARVLIENNLLIPAMNRVYYAMFYAVQALLALHVVSFSKHGQVKGYFNREFIKSGIFPVKFGKLYNTVFGYRQKFDYVDLILPEKTAIQDHLNNAETFIERICKYIKNKMS